MPSGRSSGVEHNLAKVGVEGSNPFARSRFFPDFCGCRFGPRVGQSQGNRSGTDFVIAVGHLRVTDAALPNAALNDESFGEELPGLRGPVERPEVHTLRSEHPLKNILRPSFHDWQAANRPGGRAHRGFAEPRLWIIVPQKVRQSIRRGAEFHASHSEGSPRLMNAPAERCISGTPISRRAPCPH